MNHRMQALRIAGILSLVVSAASLGSAQSALYVDAAMGQDLVGGGSPTAPLRTITFALSQSHGLELPVHIHVAPGRHDAAMGETFPLPMRPRVSVLGSGPRRTFVNPPLGANGFVFRGVSEPSAVWVEFFADTALAGMTLHPDSAGPSAGRGVVIDHSGFLACDPTLRDLEIAGFSRGIGLVSQGARPAAPEVQRVFVHGCDVGVEERRFFLALAGDFQGSTYSDSVIRACGQGMELRGDAGLGNTRVWIHLQRTELSGNGRGLRAGGCVGLGIGVRLVDSLIAGGDAALLSSSCGANSDARLDLVRCTIAGSAVGLSAAPGLGTKLSLDHTIFQPEGAATQGLADPAAQLKSVFSNLPSDWPLPLGPTDFSEDPRFSDPAQGDWSLAEDSPLLDRGDPSGMPGGTDLAGAPRRLDGLLDGVARLDIGALEYSPVALRLRGESDPGGLLRVNVQGPDPWLLIAAASAQVAELDLGPFGALLLSPAELWTLPPGSVALPNDPSLLGQELYWQALGIDPSGGVGATSRRLRFVFGWELP